MLGLHCLYSILGYWSTVLGILEVQPVPDCLNQMVFRVSRRGVAGVQG